MLHHSDIILVDHGLAGCHLHDDVTLRELEVLQFTGSQVVDGIEVVLRLLVHRGGILVHRRGEPL